MATVFTSQGVGKPVIIEELIDKYGEAKVGRWCKSPQIPDRCMFCPLIDIKPAVGFVTSNGWREGYCQEHKVEAETTTQ